MNAELSVPYNLSFEVQPPQALQSEAKFWELADQLLQQTPRFLSVTCGAGGSSSTDTERNVRKIAARIDSTAPTRVMAHLTVVNKSKHELEKLVSNLYQSGIRDFLALRGDSPFADPNWKPNADSLSSAVEIIAVLRQVIQPGPHQTEKCNIAVATFPDGNHQHGSTEKQEIENLLRKQDAGATLAITQLFYEADTFLRFAADASSAGVVIPILPGIIPITGLRQLARVNQLTGLTTPERLTKVLSSARSVAQEVELGISYTLSVMDQVSKSYASDFHIFTFNNLKVVQQLLAALSSHNSNYALK